ncbi:MAG: hypothetical protein KGJ57_23080 [Sphingomonadales bacterium]|nr:hypothetical protein [Sphingomonadales bacterium]MDE2172270.1 hypothetical protein [Sphingomonadales bacterium]
MEGPEKRKPWLVECFFKLLGLSFYILYLWVLFDVFSAIPMRLITGHWAYVRLNVVGKALGLDLGHWVGGIPLSFALLLMLLGCSGAGEGDANSNRKAFWKRTFD